MTYAIVAFVLWVIVPSCGLLWLRRWIGPDPNLRYLTVLLVGLPALCWFFIYIYPTAIYPRTRCKKPKSHLDGNDVKAAARTTEFTAGRSYSIRSGTHHG